MGIDRRRTAEVIRRPAVAHHRGQPAAPARHPEAPDAADLAGVQRWVASRTRPTAIDLFAGAGGLSLGLQQAGFDVVVGADNDAWAVHTHAANLPGLTWCGDLSDPAEFLQTLEAWGIREVDLVAGGVPCQPFSRAGSSRIRRLVRDGERAGHDARADLWESFVAVVAAMEPRAVLVENVPDLPRWEDGAVLIGFYESLRALGYRVEARILDGFRFGVPQHRQRLFLIGLANGAGPVWPEPDDELVSLWDAIGDLPIIPRAQRAETLEYDSARITSDFQREMRSRMREGNSRVVWDHISRDVRPDDMEAFGLLSEGQTYVDLPQRLRRYRSDVFTDKYKRLTWSELCRSITAHIAKDGYWYIHPDQHRTLSIREAARVQTFPDDFRFAGTQTHRYRQIGNAVPVQLGRAVGEGLLLALSENATSAPADDRFRRAVIEWDSATSSLYPWREGAEPWHVLLGELCLRRARPSSIPTIYAALLRAAPTPRALATADSPVARLTQVGLKAAAADLAVKCALVLVEEFGGEVPSDETPLSTLPGVGDYVCQAVLCFGFGRRAVLLDRNTSRVSSRVSGHKDERRFQMRLDLHRLAGARGPDRAFNQALLALGSSICTAAEPRCRSCPVAMICVTASGPGAGMAQLPLQDMSREPHAVGAEAERLDREVGAPA